ncbi:MBL fold metallo-hydrolase [Candidatus Sumerlaeota bacterium]|nr:MBL fold metallo-hydrolase [Candidatus Sumerlaeota bacterium]
MKITILGSGTSTGIPMIGCHCEVCSSSNPKNKRLRTSAFLESGDARILIDCSTDLRQQALAYHIERIDAVFLTHSHADHVAGIDDLRIYNFRQGGKIKFFGAPDILNDVRRRFDYCFDPPQTGGGVPQLELIPVQNSFEFMGISVTPLPVLHGTLPILGYRFNDFSYITDASKIPEETMEKLRGARVLILNALRKKPHSTHFSIDEAVEAARRIQPEQTYLVHMAHQVEHEATNRALPPEIQLAYDGQVINL